MMLFDGGTLQIKSHSSIKFKKFKKFHLLLNHIKIGFYFLKDMLKSARLDNGFLCSLTAKLNSSKIYFP